MQSRIVITGFGIVSSLGIGKDSFWSNLKAGLSALKPISLFDASGFDSKHAGEVQDFDPKAMINYKGLQYLDRSTKLICAAARLALDDAGLELTDDLKRRTGVVVGTTFGSLHSFSSFDRGLIANGFASISPLIFPNTVPNVPAGHVSLMLGIQGFNSTISTGIASSLNAISLAASLIASKKGSLALVGGVDSLTLESFVQFYRAGFLAKSDEICAPFDKNRNGISLAEAGAVIVLEDYDHAVQRGANICAEILGTGRAFDPMAVYSFNPEAKGAISALENALKDAGLRADSIDYLSASANSSFAGDKMEAIAINSVFKDSAAGLNVSAIKSMTGECLSASGALQVCAATLGMGEGVIPPTINLKEKDPSCNFEIITELKRSNISNAMISSVDNSGVASALIIGKA